MSFMFNATGSASYKNVFEHVVGPLRSGTRDNDLTIDAQSRVSVDWNAREPLLLVRLKQSLENETITIRCFHDPSGANDEQPGMKFDTYSEFGATLPAYQPPVDAETRLAAPVTLKFTLRHRKPDGTEVNIPNNKTADYIEAVIIEGMMAKMSWLLSHEHARMRRVRREISMMRSAQTARDSALDRMGAALGVPRFADEIAYDTAKEEIITKSKNPDGTSIIESDNDYRRRLQIYRPFLFPTRNHILEMLNGIGQESEDNKGLISGLEFQRRFGLLEQDNPFAVSIHLISSGNATIRGNFLDYLRRVYLIAPKHALESTRFLSTEERDRQKQMRLQLLQSFNFSSGHYIAPLLAVALERVHKCRRALLGASAQKRNVLKAQDDNSGSRYELGLGVEIQPITATERNQLHAKLSNPSRPAVSDTEVEGILQKMASQLPASPADDPDLSWFFNSCGLQTVHRISNTQLYLSHLPIFGLVLEGVSHLNPGDSSTINARYHAPNDPGANVVLVNGMSTAVAMWSSTGLPAWTQLSKTQGTQSWHSAVVNTNANKAFKSANLPALTNVSGLDTRLSAVPEEMLVTIKLPTALANKIRSNHADGVAALSNLRKIMAESGLVSMLPLASGASDIVVVLSVIGLPGVGSNLSVRRASGFRWYVVPINQDAGTIGSVGSRTNYNAPANANNGLCALVAVGYSRQRQLTDPYEYRVTLPSDALLNVKQYEFLMNLLAHAYPCGIEVNTWDIRQEHVDLDGDGNAEPLNISVARTYRQFRRQRHRGELGVGTSE